MRSEWIERRLGRKVLSIWDMRYMNGADVVGMMSTIRSLENATSSLLVCVGVLHDSMIVSLLTNGSENVKIQD